MIGKQAGLAKSDDDSANRKSNPKIHAVCVADDDNDGRLDLVVGDHSVVERELSADQLQHFKQASRARSDFSRRYLGMIKDAADRTRASRLWAFQTALSDWRDLSAHLAIGPAADHGRWERHGSVWLYRRLAGELK